jgi:hypothetical protein
MQHLVVCRKQVPSLLPGTPASMQARYSGKMVLRSVEQSTHARCRNVPRQSNKLRPTPTAANLCCGRVPRSQQSDHDSELWGMCHYCLCQRTFAVATFGWLHSLLTCIPIFQLPPLHFIMPKLAASVQASRQACSLFVRRWQSTASQRV